MIGLPAASSVVAVEGLVGQPGDRADGAPAGAGRAGVGDRLVERVAGCVGVRCGRRDAVER